MNVFNHKVIEGTFSKLHNKTEAYFNNPAKLKKLNSSLEEFHFYIEGLTTKGHSMAKGKYTVPGSKLMIKQLKDKRQKVKDDHKALDKVINNLVKDDKLKKDWLKYSDTTSSKLLELIDLKLTTTREAMVERKVKDRAGTEIFYWGGSEEDILDIYNDNREVFT